VRQRRFSRRTFILVGGASLASLVGLVGLRRSGAERLGAGLSSLRYDFPVLNVEGGPPAVAAAEWVLSVDGLVDEPLRLDRTAWRALPRTRATMDLHCVEGWSARDLEWEGVRVRDVLQRVSLRPEGRFVSFHAYGGSYVSSLTLDEAMAPQALLADGLRGAALPAEHGGPLRLVIPTRIGQQNVKWVARLEVSAQPHSRP
jgi:DMSO/TMAO reductase YedYZ molybdopterin-dependent catalytic subunit